MVKFWAGANNQELADKTPKMSTCSEMNEVVIILYK